MSVSQNGYKSRDSSLIASYTVVRDVKLSLRKGDVSVVLLHWARWFDKNIEPLKKESCGGYNPRHIAGSKVDSNHASGTAEDLNWNDHVQHKKNTFTAAEQKKIRAQLKYYEGVIRWGGDYSDPDDMHFEINKPPEDVARVAQKIKNEGKPQTAPTHVDVDGKLGPQTIKLWRHVMKVNVRGELTEAFVEVVQNHLRVLDRNLKVDGKLGPQTIGRLQQYLKSPVDGHITKPVSEMVKALQRRLNAGKF